MRSDVVDELSWAYSEDNPLMADMGRANSSVYSAAGINVRSPLFDFDVYTGPAGSAILTEQRNPSALWIVQQMREAWPYAPAHRFLLFDRDSKFGVDVVCAMRAMGSQPLRTAFRSPWQNGVAERWVGSCRRDLLGHVIVLNERHLKRLMAEYVRYYHEDRTHLGLANDTPAYRPIATRSAVGSKIQSFPRLGGLHHRYVVAA